MKTAEELSQSLFYRSGFLTLALPQEKRDVAAVSQSLFYRSGFLTLSCSVQMGIIGTSLNPFFTGLVF